MATAKKNGAVKETAKKTTKKKMGRPTKFTVQLGEKICVRITCGESLRSICNDEKFPSRISVHTWLIKARAEDSTQEEKDFLNQYELATEVRAENMFDELEDIADDGSDDWTTRRNARGDEYDVVDHEVVQRSRLRVDVRKWKLSKMLPKRFSDKSVVVSEDEDGNQVPISGNVIHFAPQNTNESES